MRLRTILLSIICIFLLQTAKAQTANFKEMSWEETKKMAKEQHKYILMDCFTDWCYWCKVMDKETFSNKEVADLINDKFIAVKMNMEKKGDGANLAMKFRVSSYPSYLYFNPDGKLIFSSMGYLKADKYMDVLKDALNPAKQVDFKGITPTLELNFPDFYVNAFIPVDGKRKFPDSTAVKTYLDNQKDLFSEVSWSVMYRFFAGVKYDQFFLEHASKYQELYGNEQIQRKLEAILDNKLTACVKSKDSKGLEPIFTMVDTYFPEIKDTYKNNIRIAYYKGVGDWTSFVNLAEQILKADQFKTQSQINDYSWTIYEKCEDPASVKKAVGWMEKVVAEEPSYAYLDTYAALLYKDKQYAQAEKYANLAIETGKKKKEKVTSTEELLAKIQKEKSK